MDDTLVEKIGKLLENNTSLLRKEMREMKTDLKEEIKKSQEDTIEALTAVINAGYNIHEKRIKRIEDHLNLPPTQ